MKRFLLFLLLLFCLSFSSSLYAQVELGVDVFFSSDLWQSLKNKNVGLVTNHTGKNKKLVPTFELFLDKKSQGVNLKALFCPEHGIDGSYHASEKIDHTKTHNGIPVYSLHGSSKRPSENMIKGLDIIVYDIQDIGVRSYTFASTLYYMMEEAAKRKLPLIVFDRPNPINGVLVDGPMLEDSYRSFLGYINVPYCHGLTIGELAKLFNEEYKIGCKLTVIPMKGWKRSMNFSDTGLKWIPPSPHIPESDSPAFCAATGILGEIDLVNIGVGYTMPFKVIGAKWIDAEKFAKCLNDQKLPGVSFAPFHFKPFYGSYKSENCHGVLIVIEDHKTFQPFSVQSAILGILKSLYPKQVASKVAKLTKAREGVFCKVSGTGKILQHLKNEKYIVWKLIDLFKKERSDFLKVREKYLHPDYPN